MLCTKIISLTPFQVLLNQHTGLDISTTEQDKLKNLICERLTALNFQSLESYCAFLNSHSEKSHHEWQYLVEKITILETFFLRDKGQFTLLKDHLLPEIIQRNRYKKSLRIWSAGCSTGEEPYSLALLVQELIPNYLDWDLLILGTDINQQALAKARQGIYGRWSFRGVENEILNYFQNKSGFLHLSPFVKNMVRFEHLNLLKDPYPNNLIQDMDLILCRNVFIYFTQESIKTVVNKFTKVLHKNGYLITGHGELYQQNLKELKVLNFAESIVYQRCHSEPAIFPEMPHYSALPPIMPVLMPPVLEQKPLVLEQKPLLSQPTFEVSNTADVVKDLAQLCEKGLYQKLIQTATALINSRSQPVEVYYWLAKAQANLGQYAEAEQVLQTALSMETLFPKAYYLLAHIKEWQNDFVQAKMLLQKVLYLDEKFIPAYLDLVLIYQREGNSAKAQKMQKNALNLLKALPADDYIEECEANAAEIILQLEAK